MTRIGYILATSNTLLFAVFLAWLWTHGHEFAPHPSEVWVQSYDRCLEKNGHATFNGWSGNYVGCTWQEAKR